MLVAGAMLEHHLRELLGRLDRLIHVAERRCEDELMALLSEILDDRGRARILLYVLDIVGDDLAFQRRDHRLAPLLVRPGPAPVADRAEIDEPDLQGFGRARAACERRQGEARRSGLDESTARYEAHVFAPSFPKWRSRQTKAPDAMDDRRAR